MIAFTPPDPRGCAERTSCERTRPVTRDRAPSAGGWGWLRVPRSSARKPERPWPICNGRRKKMSFNFVPEVIYLIQNSQIVISHEFQADFLSRCRQSDADNQHGIKDVSNPRIRWRRDRLV
jgi:hypothetical protein